MHYIMYIKFIDIIQFIVNKVIIDKTALSNCYSKR